MLIFFFKSIPGPGQYQLKRDLDPEPPKSEAIGLEFERPGFGSQSEVNCLMIIRKFIRCFFFPLRDLIH